MILIVLIVVLAAVVITKIVHLSARVKYLERIVNAYLYGKEKTKEEEKGRTGNTDSSAPSN